eukprot:3935322-Rhodomonas_salina.2
MSASSPASSPRSGKRIMMSACLSEKLSAGRGSVVVNTGPPGRDVPACLVTSHESRSNLNMPRPGMSRWCPMP